MAKGNMFLGMARGSVGDVTFYRADGQQLSRVRNRNPRNPKTEAQLFQRAIMATIVKAYQAGKEIFDHSFEGVSVGAGCQRKFMSLNTKMLRQLVANDINGAVSVNDQLARVVAPGVSQPVADPLIISRGSYAQSAYSWDSEGNGYTLPVKDGSDESLIEYKERVGLISGDIYTFVIFAEKTEIAYQSALNDDALASQNACDFGFVRLIVKPDPAEDKTTFNYGDIFTFEFSGGVFALGAEAWPTTGVDETLDMQCFVPNNDNAYTLTGAMGVIRSRRDRDLRSDSTLKMLYGSEADDMYGIASAYILDEWQNASPSVGNSELILEGGDV